MLAMPAMAFGVNVSSNDGAGTQYVSTWYQCGGYTTGQLRSTAGNPVYYGGLLMFNNTWDTNVGRYTSDTSSTSYVARGDSLGTPGTCSYANQFTGVKARICRNRNNFPDGCGEWSDGIRK